MARAPRPGGGARAGRGGGSGRRSSRAGGALELEQDDELVAYALERWELLHDDDLDLWLASLDPDAQVLMEYSGDALDDVEPTPPSKPR